MHFIKFCDAPSYHCFETDGFLEQSSVGCPGGTVLTLRVFGGFGAAIDAPLKSLLEGGRPVQAFTQVKFTTTKITTCKRRSQEEAEEEEVVETRVVANLVVAGAEGDDTNKVQRTKLGPRKNRWNNGVAAWRRRGVIPRRHLLRGGPEGAARAHGTLRGRRPPTGPRRHCSAVGQRWPRGGRGRP